MTELAFPIVGSLLVLLVVLPCSALFAKVTLRAVERVFGAMHAIEARFLILVGSSVLPLAWLVSAGIHQAETGRGVVACLAHPAEGVCAEPALFTLSLAAVVALLLARRAIPLGVARATIADDRAVRVLEMVGREPALARLRGRVVVRPDLAAAFSTRGVLRARVYVRSDVADALDDAALLAALAHEAAHVRAGDAARYFLLELSLALNPFGRAILGAELARWIHAREAHCDREAVLAGASPTALAHALVVAARPPEASIPALGPSTLSALKQRVELLFAYAEHPPHACCESRSVVPSVLVLALVILMPHAAGTHALDVLHTGSELVLVLLPE